MPTPEICESYNLSATEYDDCINYRGHYSKSTQPYKRGGTFKTKKNPRYKGNGRKTKKTR